MFRIILPDDCTTVHCDTEDEFIVAATYLKLGPPTEYHVDSVPLPPISDLIDNVNPAPTPLQAVMMASKIEPEVDLAQLRPSIEQTRDAYPELFEGSGAEDQHNADHLKLAIFAWNNMSEQQKQEHLMLEQKRQIERMHDSKGPFQRAVDRIGKPVGLVPLKQPNAQEVICPNCSHQFRAIPVQVQDLLKAAGYEPPFTDQIDPVAQVAKAYEERAAAETDRHVAELEQTNGNLRQEILQLSGINQSLVTDNDRLGRILMEHEQQLHTQTDRWQERSREVERLLMRVNELEQKLKATEIRNGNQSNSIRNLLNENSDLNSKLVALQKEHDDLTAKCNNNDRVVRDMAEKYALRSMPT